MLQSRDHLEIGTSAVNQTQILETLMRPVFDSGYQSTHGLQTLRGHYPRTTLNTSSASSPIDFAMGADLQRTSTTDAIARCTPRLPPVQLQLARHRRCKSYCGCSCHKPRQLKSPSILNRVLGSLFIGYCAIPTVLAGKCDTASCLNRPTAILKVIYIFPYWVFCRAIYLTMTYSRG